MNYQTLHTAIDAYIKRNGRQEITGNILNGVLSLMTDTLGEGYQFGGVISPDTIFMPTDAKEFFICSEPGTYISFGGIVAEEGELTLITYSDGFAKSVITGVGGAEGAVKYDGPQTLTTAQQQQARNNIDAASKAQVTRIALNVGFTDKIKDTATTLEDLSNKVSIINVIDGDRIAGCILPSSQTGQIGWLYEFEEGWMLTKDISGYVIGEHTWEDLLWYLDANSSKIMTYERMLETTGDKSQLTTTDKSNLVNAINEVKQGGGGANNKPWDETFEETLDTDAGFTIVPDKPIYHARIKFKKPAGAASSYIRLLLHGPNGSSGGFISPSFSVNLDVEMRVVGNSVIALARSYNDAQNIFTMTSQIVIDDSFANKNDISISRIESVSTLPAGSQCSFKMMYL